ncbi:hypothetical protein J1N35_026126 [Gossypium stocksii]|uniref:Aminotransferase-like plant mobile domain-containing protein n=1 Tax=Gossypium stocksii TaxID=47602 RepID=A0A9D3VA85_9ROSI|nr:hypothetical protein J1N35_026126 [Gossypium stocksii]
MSTSAKNAFLGCTLLTWTKRSPRETFCPCNGSGILARGHDRPGVQVGPDTNQCIDREVRPKTHTFHLPCEECTITLEDAHLQLGLPVDGYAIIGSASSTDWGVICYELLGAIPDNINGGRIEIGWLRDTFPESDNDSTELERIRYARAYILEMIGEQPVIELGVCRVGNVVQGNVRGDTTKQSQNRSLPITTAIMGTVSLSIFTSSSEPPIHISTHNKVELFGELCRNTYLSRRYTASIRPTIGSTISMDTIQGFGNSGSNSG